MYLFIKEKKRGIGMNYSQKYFVIMGIIFLFMSGFMILTGIMTHSAASHNVSIAWDDDYEFLSKLLAPAI